MSLKPRDILLIFGVLFLISFTLLSTFPVVESIETEIIDFGGLTFHIKVDDEYRIFEGCDDLGNKNNLCHEKTLQDQEFVRDLNTFHCPIYEYAHTTYTWEQCREYRCVGVWGDTYRRYQDYPKAGSCGPINTEGGPQFDKVHGCVFRMDVYKEDKLIYSLPELIQQYPNEIILTADEKTMAIFPEDLNLAPFDIQNVQVDFDKFRYDSYNDCRLVLDLDDKSTSNNEEGQTRATYEITNDAFDNFLRVVDTFKRLVNTIGAIFQ